MPKRCITALLAAILTLSLFAGCGGKAPVPGSGESSPSPPAGTSVPAEQGEHLTLTPETKELYAGYLRPLADNGILTGEEEILNEGESYGIVQDLEVVDAVLTQDAMTMTAELYGIVKLDPKTGEERVVPEYIDIPDTVTVRSPADAPHAPYLLLGTATVELRDTANGMEVLSHQWQPLENPGRQALEKISSEFAEQISASEKPDLSGYDRRLVDYLYQVITSQRLIGGPEEITRWDLENLCTQLELSCPGTVDPDTGEYTPDPVPLDAGLLRLIPGLRSCSVHHPLADYSVFEGMDRLETLYFYTETEDIPLDFSTLRIGHANTLTIHGFRQDIALDLSGCQVDKLSLHSWVAAVTELKGCEGLRELELNHTRTDTRIINAGNLPDVKMLNLSFMSDYPRVRDFSQLATFGEDVEIHLTLTYQAANNKTVETLAGVRLDSLTLDPKNGQWPLDEPDPALVDLVQAKRLNWVGQ